MSAGRDTDAIEVAPLGDDYGAGVSDVYGFPSPPRLRRSKLGVG